MHAIEGSANVPAFLTKLWRLVDDANTNDLISWTQGGRSFIIQNQAKFARELLPQYYKHNNMASFVRQLNMYGFHKVVSADSGGLRVERDEMEFAHQHFVRGQESLLENIKRKIPTSRSVIVEDNKNVNKLLHDVRDIKRDQDSMSSKLLNLKRENEALWREYASMRQKFTKQQQIIEKLIHFLIAMVKSPAKGLVPKRKFGHLALEGGEESTSAATKINPLQQFSQGNTIDQILGECEANMTGGGGGGGGGGAQIQEVTEDPEPIQDAVILPDGNESCTNTTAMEGSSSEITPGTIVNVNGEPMEFVTVPSMEHITATNVVSPEGTVIMDSVTDTLLDDSPLSPELLNTVDPSVVTQSFKYPASNTQPIITSDIKEAIPSGSSATVPTSSVNTQVHALPQKGKKRSLVAQKRTPPQDSSMKVAVPDKTIHKQELQSQIDEMQATIDSLQDFLSSNNINVDSSMLYSVFAGDNYLPELDSMATVSSGNELSVYNPNLLDLAGDIEEESEEDPFSFLSSNMSTTTSASAMTSSLTTTTTSSTSATTNTTSTVPSNKSTRPPHSKHLKVTIKKEAPEPDSSLETPIVSPMMPSPLYRGKRRTN